MEITLYTPEGDWTVFTNAAGFYSADVHVNPGDGIAFIVRAPLAAKLAWINIDIPAPGGDYVQDFSLAAGNLLEIQVPVAELWQIWWEVFPLNTIIPRATMD